MDSSHLEARLDRMENKLDALIIQTTKTNGRVSTQAMILYPLSGVVLLLVGSLLGSGVIQIGLFK